METQTHLQYPQTQESTSGTLYRENYQIIENERLTGLNFDGLSLNGSLFSLTMFHNVTFTNCDFFASRFENCQFINCSFLGCNMEFVTIEYCDFHSSLLNNCKVTSVKGRKNLFSQCVLGIKEHFFFSKGNKNQIVNEQPQAVESTDSEMLHAA